MQPKAVNGLMLYVTDVGSSLDFYEKLGFTVIQREAIFGSLQLGEILLQLQDKTSPSDPAFIAEALAEPKGGGLFVFIQVGEIDRYFENLVAAGIDPTTSPRDWPTGNREFVVRDPDGYKLVFYQPHGAKTIRHEHQ